MRVRLTRWTGETREFETASVPLALVQEYPEFATQDQTEDGWLVWVEAEGETNRYAPATKVTVFNANGDVCATIEQI